MSYCPLKKSSPTFSFQSSNAQEQSSWEPSLRHPQKIAQSRKFGSFFPFPVYHSSSLAVYCLGQDVYSKSGVPSPNPSTRLHASTNSGSVGRFSGPLTATCHFFQRPAIFKELLPRKAWLSVSCPTCYHWPLFLFQESHPQGLTLTFFNTSSTFTSRYKHRYSWQLMTIYRIPIKSPLQRKARELSFCSLRNLLSAPET